MNDLLKDGIISKLKEFSAYIDNELPDYIMVMLANNKTISQINQDLQLFLGENTDNFTAWLQDVVANPALLKKKGGGARESKVETPAGGVAKKDEPEKVAEKTKVVDAVAEGSDVVAVGGRERGKKGVEEERRRSGGKGGAARGRGDDREEDGSRREGRKEDGRTGGEGIQSQTRPKKRTRLGDSHSGGVDESDDHYPPSPKHSRMRSDRYERDREENSRPRERWRSPPEGRSRGAARKTVRAQPDSTKDQDLRGYIEGGRRHREAESRLRRRSSPRGHREPMRREGSEEGEEVEEEMVAVGIEEEEEDEMASTTVASVVRLVDSTRPRRTNEGGSRLLHRAILGLRPQGGVAITTRGSISKREKVLLLPQSALGDTPPSSVILTKTLLDRQGHGRIRQDISSTQSDNSDENINQEEEEDMMEEEIVVDTRGIELQTEFEDEGIDSQAEFKSFSKDHRISSPRVGHRIKVVTSTRTAGGRGYDEAEDREDGGLDLRALINKSKEGKVETQSPRFVVTLGGMDLPEATPNSRDVPIVPTSTTVARKSVKERLGKKQVAPPISTASPAVPAATEVTVKRAETEHNAAAPTSMSDLPEKCRFWPNCKNGDKCPYHHPTIPCKLFPDCKYGKKCLFLHPKCKFDSRCTRADCSYLHTAPRHLSLQQPQNVLPQVISTPIPVMSPMFRSPVFTSNQYNYGSSGPSPRSRSFRYPNKSSLSWKPPQTTSERAFAVPEEQTASLPV